MTVFHTSVGMIESVPPLDVAAADSTTARSAAAGPAVVVIAASSNVATEAGSVANVASALAYDCAFVSANELSDMLCDIVLAVVAFECGGGNMCLAGVVGVVKFRSPGRCGESGGRVGIAHITMYMRRSLQK